MVAMNWMKQAMRVFSGGVVAGLAIVGGACTYDESEDSLEFRTTIGCSSCGIGNSNTAHVNNYPIDQLHLYGDANADGVTVLGVQGPGGPLYQLRTEGDELIAWDPGASAAVADGAALVGWTIKLYHAGNAELLEVFILGYDDQIALPYDDNGQTISAYALGYHPIEAPSETHSVCPQSTAYPDVIAATIVRGELYDAATGAVAANQEWLTIACFGNAVAKTKLFGYGPHEIRPDDVVAATIPQRQATIRMLTADYCGTGHSFTVDGTPLAWKNDNGGVKPDDSPDFDDIEALWDEDGALCLTRPRLADIADVRKECELPECSEKLMGDAAWDWVTWRVP